ncbi:MAG TPA: RHS repeat-associated core domain-containing protein, partial [Chryseolinea sp.]|nr:RHS repeat-associated core domain-containing protein [Chryseolinea sp.]
TGGVLMPFWVLFADDHDDGNDDAPKAYLNWLVFDNDYNLIPSQSSYKQISRDGREYGQDGSHDKLFKDLTIGQAGYVYLYVSNDHYELEGEVVEVYWDDFKVEHVKSPVISSQDYYPFGLTFNASQREGSSPQGFLYQEKELQDELNVNLYDFEWRQYDPLIGRTTSMDAHADSYHLLSPYSWVANNPLSLIDPDGQDYTEAEIAAHYEGLSAQVFAMELQARSEARKPPVLSFNSKNRERREAYNQAVKDLGPPPNSTDLILAGVGTAGFIAETQAVIIRSSRAGYTSGKLFSSSPAVYPKKTARSVSLGAKVVGMGLTFWGIYNTERQFRSGQIDEGRRRLSHLNNGVGALFPRMALPLAVGDYLGQKYHNEIINDVTQPGGILFDLTRTTLEFLGIPIEAKPKK